MKYLLFIAAFLLASCGSEEGPRGPQGPAGSYANELNTFLENTSALRASVLDIFCNDGESYWRGSGTKIVGDRILTAHHVVEDAESCSYYSEDVWVGSNTNVFTTQVEDRDQAYIESPDWNFTGEELKAARMSSFDLQVGDLFLLLAYPKDFDENLQSSFGHILDDDVSSDLGQYSTYWSGAATTDAVAYSGSSGGPVFNKQGRIVALLVGGYPSTNFDANFILPVH